MERSQGRRSCPHHDTLSRTRQRVVACRGGVRSLGHSTAGQRRDPARVDPRATAQAAGVVVLAAVAAGVGSGARGFGEFVGGTLAALVSWFVWAYLAYWIGSRVLPEAATHASHAQRLRTVGFASAPGVLRVLGVIGPFRGLVFVVAAIWMLVATVIAVRQALDYKSTWRAGGVKPRVAMKRSTGQCRPARPVRAEPEGWSVRFYETATGEAQEI